MDMQDEKQNVAVTPCESEIMERKKRKEESLRKLKRGEENQELRDKLQKLEETSGGTMTGNNNKDELTLLEEEKIKNDKEIKEMPGTEKKERKLELTQEQVKRLKADYDDVVKKNQELENRILQLASELASEKSRFEETVGAMSEQLMDFVEKMNKLEKESMKNKKDCSLVVQLLKCNQSLDRKFVSQKMDMLPSELKDKLTIELDLKQEQEPLRHHPAWSKKVWRTKSTGSNGNAKTDARRKTFHSYTLNE